MSEQIVVHRFRFGGSSIVMSLVAVAIGLLMLFYPGGTMRLMAAAFTLFQAVLTIFILAYAFSEAIVRYRAGQKGAAAIFALIGLLATILVWLFDAGVIYLIVAVFLIIAGIGDVLGAVSLVQGRFFLLVLGLINIIMGIVILQFPVALPILMAWYVLFWGISRLLLALELRRMHS